MQVRIDPLGTLVGHCAGTQPNAPALLIGSPLDRVRDAGRYDDPLGILLGIECVAALHAQERRLPFAIDVVAFGDEEGSRFPASLFCSRAVTGTLDPTTLTVTDAAGITVASALAEWNLDIAHVQHAARAPGSVLAYLETHIDHGPVPEAEALPVGSGSGSGSDIAIAIAAADTDRQPRRPGADHAPGTRSRRTRHRTAAAGLRRRPRCHGDGGAVPDCDAVRALRRRHQPSSGRTRRPGRCRARTGGHAPFHRTPGRSTCHLICVTCTPSPNSIPHSAG